MELTSSHNVRTIILPPFPPPHTSYPRTQLEAIKRVDQTEWTTEVILPSVSFAPLILPSAESVKDLEALEICESCVVIHRPAIHIIPRVESHNCCMGSYLV